mmetsp:Transcript_17509/g.32600  ORF Transcript_17509/g.32600 Transcript_17509/m.32600 type:complete len:359 (-) Transcript_17509:10-1086(-)
MGHSEESYIRQTCAEICIKDPRHPKVVAMNYHGAFNHSLGLSGKGGYSLYDTVDLSILINHLRQYHHGPLYAIGFSMGAAKLANYLGRAGNVSNLDAACCVSCPWDFTENNLAVHKPSLTERGYHFVLTSAIKTWVAAHYFELKLNDYLVKNAPVFSPKLRERLWWWLSCWDMKSFDETFTIKWLNYENITDYYATASPCQVLHKVETPLLIINSRNDPLIPCNVNPDQEDVDLNPNLCAIETVYGGHIGFWTPFNGCWSTQSIIKFFAQPHLSGLERRAERADKKARRRDSLTLATKLRDTSKTNLTDYTQLLHVHELSDDDDDDAESDKTEKQKIELFKKSPSPKKRTKKKVASDF